MARDLQQQVKQPQRVATPVPDHNHYKDLALGPLKLPAAAPDAAGSDAAAHSSLTPPPQLITHAVRRDGKKLQLRVGSMGLRFEDRGAPVDSYPFALLRGWQENPDALELDFQDGKHVSIKTEAGVQIAAAMALGTNELARATRVAVSQEEAARKTAEEATAEAARAPAAELRAAEASGAAAEAVGRGLLGRRAVERRRAPRAAAIVAQAAARGRADRLHGAALRAGLRRANAAAATVQRAQRARTQACAQEAAAVLAVRRALESYAALVLQSWWRGMMVVWWCRGATRAVLLLQSGGRGLLTRRSTRLRRRAAAVIQGYARGARCRRGLLKLAAAAGRLQARSRGVAVRREVLVLRRHFEVAARLWAALEEAGGAVAAGGGSVARLHGVPPQGSCRVVEAVAHLAELNDKFEGQLAALQQALRGDRGETDTGLRGVT
jgi:hypothetical protein